MCVIFSILRLQVVIRQKPTNHKVLFFREIETPLFALFFLLLCVFFVSSVVDLVASAVATTLSPSCFFMWFDLVPFASSTLASEPKHEQLVKTQR